MKKLVLLLMLIVTLASCGKKEEKKEYITYDTAGGETLEPQLITDDLKLLVPDGKMMKVIMFLKMILNHQFTLQQNIPMRNFISLKVI